MAAKPSREQECRQDMLCRLQKLLDLLEGRIDALHETPEMQNMRPGECEQAIDRHIALSLRILHIRQQFVQDEQEVDRASLLEMLLTEDDEASVQD